MKNCLRCDKKFEPIKGEGRGQGLINYCSMKCRQGKEWSKEAKEKKSDANKIDFTEADIEKIIKVFNETKTLKETAKIIGSSPKVIKRIVNFKKSVPLSNYENIKNWRKRNKERLVEYKGGKCYICNYDKCISALDFHHLDPKEKDFNIGDSGKTLSFEKSKNEVDKCILVCSNCHREIHAGLITIKI